MCVCAAQVWRSVVIGPAQTHILVCESWKVEMWDIKDFLKMNYDLWIEALWPGAL